MMKGIDMTAPTIIIVTMLALSGFLFWVANRYKNFMTGCFAAGVLFSAVAFTSSIPA